ncbi:MAG: argininosuccinate lyase, partial [Rhodospirillales bacterium]|nr:argininosuccinate lyase [Rhodospirillales bacterium]
RRRLNENPLGAGALAGTSFPIDREMTARDLGFDGPAANSLDAVSDRDFAIEYLSLASLLAVHLSRLADEVVLWSSTGFGFIRLPDNLSTGSSMLPQKRNPDAAELVRAKTGRVIGALNTLLVVMKGLPLAYSKDMQEDKEPVFDAADSLELCLAAMEDMVRGLSANEYAMRDAALEANSGAVDLADWMVKTLDRPFREAHHAVGRLVKLGEEKKLRLDQLSLEDMCGVDPEITQDALDILDMDRALAARASFGGTAPKNVLAACTRARERFLKTEE